MLRWTTPAGDARATHPARRRPAVRRRSSASARRSSPGPSSQHSGFTEAHLAASRFVGYRDAVDARRPRSAACSRPASRSSTPTTTASTRSPTSTASASTTTPSCAPPTASSADVLDVAAARRGAGRHRRPRPGRGRRQRRRARPPTCSADVADAVGRGPVPLAARPPGRRRRPARRRPPSATATTPGSSPASRSIDEGWFGPTRHRRRRRPGSATSPSSPASRSPSTTPPTPGPFALVCRHGSLTVGRDAACRCWRRRPR